MATLSFEQPAGSALWGTALFVMPHGVDDAGWSAYLLGRTDTPPDTPITIAQSYSAFSGHYLFALTAPSLKTAAEVSTFISGVRGYLDSAFGQGSPKQFNGQACVWIPDPATPSFGPPGACAFTFQFGLSQTATLGTDFNNPIGSQLTLSVPATTSIAPTDTGLSLTGSGAVALGFTTSPSNQGPTVDPNAAQLPFVGPFGGCLVLGGEITPSVLFSFLDAGVRYCFPGASQSYPVLSAATSTPVTYAGSVDPLDPVNAAAVVNLGPGGLRTVLAPVDAPELDSWVRVANGQPVQLVPVGGADSDGLPRPYAGGFVFERGDDGDDVYLTFAGDWGIVSGTAPAELLCGIFGLERIGFRQYAKATTFDRLRFQPGKPAYASHFPFAESSLVTPAADAPLLDDTRRTSWATVVSGDASGVGYTAQPESSPLYATPDSAGILDWLPTAVDLPTADGFAFPLAPYAGLGEATGGFPPEQLAPFESEVLAPERKRRIASHTLAPLRKARAARLLGAGDPPTTATTPQGFLVTLSGSNYANVTLARSVTGPDFAFGDPDAELQSLLQTNQLFAVIVDPTHVGAMSSALGAPTFASLVTMAGWQMTADVGKGSTATDYRNVVIFKFCDGTLQDRIANPSRWSDATNFSIVPGFGEAETALTGLSQWLQQFVADALAENAADNTLYGDFASIVTDASWRGILVLQADIAPSGLPAQIQGLAAGVDFSAFLAHHFGTTVTPVTMQNGTLSISGPSSLFGLIDYELPQYRSNVAGGADPDMPLPLKIDGSYGFTVLQLQALFENAALVDFRSRVQLTADELFGSKVTAAYGTNGQVPATAVVLQGTYQSQGGQPSYIFQEAVTTVFALDSNVLDAVSMSRVQFNTLTSDAGGDDATIRSRFLIWGTLAFALLEDAQGGPFDALSFGSPPGTKPAELTAGLAFSNLAIDLASPVATPHAITFTFDPAALAFDLASSTARIGSLFETLALQLDSFIAAPSDRRASDYGYLTVGMGAPLEALDGLWFAVVYKITLGTPGALVAQAGFESKLLLAWSPQTKPADATYSVFAGLELPGAAPGAKLFSLQGVLKLTIDQIQLLYGAVAGGAADTFTLRLSNVGLTFLGVAKLPPGATINFFLFGDPQGTGSLGWYAAYVANPSVTEPEELVALEAPK